MMCQCRFIPGKICTVQVSDGANGGGCACVRAGNIWEITVPPCQFCCKPKAALKNKVFGKKITCILNKVIHTPISFNTFTYGAPSWLSQQSTTLTLDMEPTDRGGEGRRGEERGRDKTRQEEQEQIYLDAHTECQMLFTCLVT